jgi:flagellar biosynthesis component FlhA
MPSFIESIEDLINEGNLGSKTSEKILTPHLFSAELELRKAITTEKYDEYLEYKTSEDAEEKQVHATLKKAEINLALSYAVHALNIETQGSGIVRSKGWDQSRSDLLSRNEVKDLSEHFREIAMRLIQPYLPEDSTTVNEDDTPDDIDTGSIMMSAI